MASWFRLPASKGVYFSIHCFLPEPSSGGARAYGGSIVFLKKPKPLLKEGSFLQNAFPYLSLLLLQCQYLGMICSKTALITDPVVAEAVGNAFGHLAS